MNPLRRQLTDLDMERFFKVIQLIREIEPVESKVNELPIQTLLVFLYIASHNGCHKKAMEEDLGMSKASGSRNSDWLARLHRDNRPGLNLITKEIDPADKRMTILKLTRKGKDLVFKISRLLYDN